MPELRVDAVMLKQRGRPLYMFALPSDILRDICWVLPRSRDNPTEIQRKLDKAKLQKIGLFLGQENSFLPNSIILNLTSQVIFQPSGDEKSGILIFPSDGSENKGKDITEKTNKYGYILDGQHRLVGFDYAPGVVFDLPVTAFIDADQSLGKKVFTDINSNQTKVSMILLQAIQFEIGELEPERQASVSVTKRLGDQIDSPFHGMVKFNPDERGKISAVTLASNIRPIIGLDGPLNEKNENQRVQILRNYFQAFKELYPDAWNSKTHVLTKTIGLYVMCGIFRQVYQKCERYEGRSTETTAFKNQLKGLLSVPEFDWSSSKFGSMTNRKGIEALRRAVLRVLPLESDTEPDLSVLRNLSRSGVPDLFDPNPEEPEVLG
jgi:DGQHR domain-containing protein